MTVPTMPSWSRRRVLGLAAAIAGATAARAGIPARRRVIIDTLGGLGNPNRPPAPDPGQSQELWQIDERALRDGHESGLCAFNQTIGYVAGPDDPYQATLADIARWTAFIDAHADQMLLARSAADIDRACDEGRFAVILGFQNTAMLGLDAARVGEFAGRGIRVMQLTYNVRNAVGDGAMVSPGHGLTPFGHEVVRACNHHRLIVDLSHSGEQTCLDAVAASRAPIAITHTGCRAVADLPRNKTDRELRLVASRGGVVGIYFMPFLAIGRQPTADDLIAHIEHAIGVCGEDHVAIGTDGTLSAVDDMAAYLEGLRTEVEQRRAAAVVMPET